MPNIVTDHQFSHLSMAMDKLESPENIVLVEKNSSTENEISIQSNSNQSQTIIETSSINSSSLPSVTGQSIDTEFAYSCFISLIDKSSSKNFTNFSKKMSYLDKDFLVKVIYEFNRKRVDGLNQDKEALRKENTELKEKYVLLENEVAKLQRLQAELISSEMSSIDLLNSYKSVLDDLQTNRLDLRKKLLECESEIKKIELKSTLRKMSSKILDLEGSNIDDNVSSGHLYLRKLHFEERKNELLGNVSANEERIGDLEQLIKSKVSKDDYFVDSFFREKHMEAELQDKLVNDAHHTQVSHAIINQLQSWLSKIGAAVKLNRTIICLLGTFNKLTEKSEAKETSIWPEQSIQKQSSAPWTDFDNLLKLSVYTSASIKKQDESLQEIKSPSDLKDCQNNTKISEQNPTSEHLAKLDELAKEAEGSAFNLDEIPNKFEALLGISSNLLTAKQLDQASLSSKYRQSKSSTRQQSSPSSSSEYSYDSLNELNGKRHNLRSNRSKYLVDAFGLDEKKLPSTIYNHKVAKYHSCPYCGIVFSSRCNAIRHINSRLQNGKFFLPACKHRMKEEPEVNGVWLQATKEPIPVNY